MHRRNAMRALLPTLALAMILPGCGPTKLETGYQPRPIKATAVDRRGYYAGPFSAEARAAQQADNAATFGDRRPGN